MNFLRSASAVAIGLFLLTAIGCAPESNAPNPPDRVDKAIQDLASGLPQKVDAATTLVEVRGDGKGGVIYVDEVDTSMVSIPSQSDLKHMLCDVGPDSPPVGNQNPFSGITYIYRDLQGNELVQLHLGPGECPGQAL